MLIQSAVGHRQNAENEANAFMFFFRFTTDDECLSVVSIMEPYEHSRERWKKFIENVKTETDDSLEFSNGHTVIECNEGRVLFISHGVSSMSFSFPLELYKDELVTHFTKSLESNFAKRWVS
jgi:hypothetical protein